MSIKPKTSRRLLLLAGIILLLVLAAGGLFVFKNVQRSRKVQEQRAEGLRLVAEHRYYEAMTPLKKFLERFPNDIEALRAYAQSRENVEDPEGAHITQAAGFYQKVYALNRNDRETALHLLQLYGTAGMAAETISLAEDLRPADVSKATKDDLPILRAEGAARSRAKGRDDKTAAILARILALDPEDFGTRVVYAQWLRGAGKRDEAMALVREYAASHAGDPRGSLLEALVREGDSGYDSRGALFAALCEINGLDPESAGPAKQVTYTDPLDVLRSATMFDGLSAHAHSLAVLLEGTRQTKDPVIKRLLVRRLWMAGREADVLTQTSDADLTPAGTHSELLLFRALALRDSGDNKGARAVADAITSRLGDYRAGPWKLAFPVLLADPPLTPEQAVSALTDACKKAPQEPLLAAFLGDALQSAGRVSDARDAWKRAALLPMATAWTRPSIGQAYSYLAENRPQSALAPAQTAARIAPRSMTTYLCLFRTNVALLIGGYEGLMSMQPAPLLDTTDRLDAELALANSPEVQEFRRNVLPGRVLLTSRAKGAAPAASLITESLKTFPDLSATTLQELLDVCAKEKLNVESDVLARLQTIGAGSPQAAYAAALTRLRSGDADGATAMLTDAANKSPASDRAQWRMAVASLLEAAGKPQDARKEWSSIAAENPTQLQVQLAALGSPAVCADRTLVESLIATATKLGNYEPTRLPAPIQFARARSLLTSPVTLSSRNSAMETLRSLLAAEPDWVEARLLLVSALMLDDATAGIKPMPNEASEQIRALIPMVPDPTPLNLQLAQLQAIRGDVASAKAQLEAITTTPNARPEVKLQAIDLLISYRELASAASALERFDASSPGDLAQDVKVRLASIYRSLSRDRESLALLQELAKQKLKTAEYALAVATDLATLSQKDAARGVLSQLDTMTLKPGEKESLLARFESQFGAADQTAALLDRAASLDQTNPDRWVSLVAYLNEQGRTDDASAALAKAKAALPGNARIGVLEKQLTLAKSSQSGTLDLNAIAEVLDQQPEMKFRAAGIREVAAARSTNQLTDTTVVDRISQKYAAEPTVQTLLSQVLMQTSPPQPQKAMEILRRALRDHPRSADIASHATGLFRSTQQWTDMLAASRAWSELTRDPNADLAIAEAMIALDRNDSAAEAIAKYVDSAKANPDEVFSLRVLDLTARAMTRAGKGDAALALLTPLIEKSSRVRAGVFLPIAGQLTQDETSAANWISRVTPVLSATSADEQLAFAAAHVNLAKRFPGTSQGHLDIALNTISRLANAPGAPAGVHEALGTVQLFRHDNAAATVAFRKALELNPRSLPAMRSLAGLLTQQNPTEAVALAEQALTISGSADPESQDVLARAYASRAATERGTQATRSYERAAQAYDALLTLQPLNVTAMLGAISCLDAADRTGDTLQYYDRILAIAQLPQGVTRASIQNNFADAIVRAGRKGEELSRAASLARQASVAEPTSASFDTLASVLAAQDKRAEAIETFHHALELDASMPTSLLGLAQILADGSEPERSEARALLARFDALPNAPQTLKDRAGKIRAGLK